MVIDVPFGTSRWPPSCPCCGRRADDTLELKRSRGMFLVVAATETVVTLKVPYCRACVRHARAYQRGTFGGLVYPSVLVLAGAFFAGMIALAVNDGGIGSFQLTMLLRIPAAVTILFIAAKVIQRRLAHVERPHLSTAPVLRIRSWTSDSVELECANDAYAAAFQEVNPPRQVFGRGW